MFFYQNRQILSAVSLKVSSFLTDNQHSSHKSRVLTHCNTNTSLPAVMLYTMCIFTMYVIKGEGHTLMNCGYN